MEQLPKTFSEYYSDLDYERSRHRKMEFAEKRHVKYFQMCLNVLPTRIQSQDSNKMALVHFGLLALDMLNNSDSVVHKSDEQRQATLDWIYSHYNKDGFRGSLTHDLKLESSENSYDPACLPATYFGLCILATMKDNSMIHRVDRFRIMSYVKKCQLPNGAFTSILDVAGKPYGEHDLRICLIASSIRKMLQMDKATDEEREKYDIHVDRLEAYIMKCLSYNGGFGGCPGEEAHAGYTFCGLAALKLIERIPHSETEIIDKFGPTIQWLSERQIWFNKYNQEEFEQNDLYSFDDLGGLNGRENKYADTCYAFWVVGSLALLGKEHIIHVPAMEYYLLKGTQNLLIGGFSKIHDEMPDAYHACLGITALKLVHSKTVQGLKHIDNLLVITDESSKFLQNLKWEN